MKKRFWKGAAALALAVSMILADSAPALAQRGEAEIRTAGETAVEADVKILKAEETAVEVEILTAEDRPALYDAGSSEVFATTGEAAAYLREQMVLREGEIQVTLPASLVPSSPDRSIFYEIMDKAVECTDQSSGVAGDALLFGRNGYSGSILSLGDTICYQYHVKYQTTREQEEALTVKVGQAMEEMALTGLSEVEKIKKIHDYICDHVNYDYTYQKYTSYDALCTGTSVCQGYALLFYRLAKEAGLSVRIISGKGGPTLEGHAWNIVRIGSLYYNIDCTWDGQDDETRDIYFLKSENDFGIHLRDAKYDTPAFHLQYPMTKDSYVDFSTFEPGKNQTNYSAQYAGVKGGSVSVTASGKPRVLIFFRTTCWNSQMTVKGIADNDSWGDVDFAAIEIDRHTQQEVLEFQETYGNDEIEFGYDVSSAANSIMWKYIRMLIGNQSSISLPVLVYIDADNKVQHLTSNYQSTGDIAANLKYYCGWERPDDASSTQGPQTGSLTGKVKSHGDSQDAAVVELVAGEAMAMPDLSLYFAGETIMQTNVSGGSYAFEGIPAGEYLLRVRKKGHVTREYRFTFDGTDDVLDAEIFLKGDVDLSGEVDIGDHQRLFTHLQGTNLITDEYQEAIADVDGSNVIDIGDHQRLFTHLQGTNSLWN